MFLARARLDDKCATRRDFRSYSSVSEAISQNIILSNRNTFRKQGQGTRHKMKATNQI